MNRLFECIESGFFKIRDGTLVNPFLNPGDIMSGLPGDAPGGIGIAAGYIDRGIVSAIHVHPFITQVTVLVSGSLDIHMKDQKNGDTPYTLALRLPISIEETGFRAAAVMALPGTFIQMDNSQGPEPVQVLYITSPAFISEPGETTDAPPIYNDAVMVGQDWGRLAEQNWNPPELSNPACSAEARQRAMARMTRRTLPGSR